MSPLTLLVDAGNTRIKAALLKKDTLGKTYAFSSLPHFFNFFSKKRFHQSIFSSVLSDKETHLLSQGLRNVCETVLSIRTLSRGMICSKYDLQQLGEDRLAKLLYARCTQKKPCVLIDAGTALTVDFFSPPNIFLGGFILGGFSLEYKALSEKTRKLPYIIMPSPKRLSRLPKNTDEAIHQGVLESKALGIRALIEKIGKQEKTPFSQTPILLTGGEAKLLTPYFPNGFVQENLVLQGLRFQSLKRL
jgi:type III pantothenate kinase